jgi:cob(I)alamin adenosyltransferase
MKIYTKTGDKGQTSLYGGQRLSKNDIRIEAYGTVDELNSYIGWIKALDLQHEDDDLMKEVQDQLFSIGSHLASDPKGDLPLPDINMDVVTAMEHSIDRMNDELPRLKSFILPGGSTSSSLVHVGRTVCRRAERRVVGLAEVQKVNDNIIVFLNRLSDYLFVFARYVLLKEGKQEVPWTTNS